MDDTTEIVRSHYGRTGLMERILVALSAAGVDPEKLRYEDLFPFDQLHGVGIVATRDHAERAQLRAGMHVLDLGCGVGGSSRYLAANCHCRVTGIDLTPEFVDVARDLTHRCGLGNDIEFRAADAMSLPFPDSTFDHVWCHNVTMNIPDKKGLAIEIARVLKRGGRFSCVETAQGPAGAPTFPMPWAMDASSSFLATPEQMREAIEAGGLRIVRQLDITRASLNYATEVTERVARGEPPPLRNGVIMGDDFAVRARNSAMGLTERRLLDQFVLADKP